MERNQVHAGTKKQILIKENALRKSHIYATLKLRSFSNSYSAGWLELKQKTIVLLIWEVRA